MEGLEIGIVIFFDGSYGRLVSQTGQYLFFQEDIEDKTLLSKGRIVIFRGERIQDTNRAFFIKGAETILNQKIKRKDK